MKTEQTNQPKTWTFHRDSIRRKKTGELDKALREDMRTERQTVRNLFHWTDAGVWPGRVWTLRTASLQLTTCENGARLNTWSSTCTTSVDERERQRETYSREGYLHYSQEDRRAFTHPDSGKANGQSHMTSLHYISKLNIQRISFRFFTHELLSLQSKKYRGLTKETLANMAIKSVFHL